MSLKDYFHKPICFIAHGHSLKLLDDNINKFKNKDVHWVSLNSWSIASKVLKKIGKKLDACVMYSKDYGNEETEGIRLAYSKGRGCSMQEFLEQLKDCNYRKPVMIFGADGYSDTGEHYYQNYATCRGQNHKSDLEHFNETFISRDNFYNVNPESHYEPVKKIGVKECLSLL